MCISKRLYKPLPCNYNNYQWLFGIYAKTIIPNFEVTFNLHFTPVRHVNLYLFLLKNSTTKKDTFDLHVLSISVAFTPSQNKTLLYTKIYLKNISSNINNLLHKLYKLLDNL